MSVSLRFAKNYILELSDIEMFRNDEIINFMRFLSDNLNEYDIWYDNDYSIDNSTEFEVNRKALDDFVKNVLPNNDDPSSVPGYTYKDIHDYLQKVLKESDPNNDFVYFVTI